jgi:hypothetical protein
MKSNLPRFLVLLHVLLLVSCAMFSEIGAQPIGTSMEGMLNLNRPRDESARKRIGPEAADIETYKSFLKLPKTGITRLVTQKPCDIPFEKWASDLDKFAKECPTHYIPGGGSSFSFRKEDYTFAPHADITMKGKLLYSMGTLAQGIMVSLGDIPLGEVSLKSDGITFLDEFAPGRTAEEIDLQTAAFNAGVKNGKYLYSRGFNIEHDSTFGLRVVAYRANLQKEIQLSEEQKAKIDRAIRDNPNPIFRDLRGVPMDPVIKSDPLFGDVRKDIIVAFRIAKVAPDGSVTLIWKELKRTDSPKFEVKKK